MRSYESVKKRMMQGWNTWNTRSVLSHVLMPKGFALHLGIKEYQTGYHLHEALIGRQGKQDEVIFPGPHAYDGSYTSLVIQWRGVELEISTAVEGDDLVALVTPRKNQLRPAVLVAEASMLWNRSGLMSRAGDTLCAALPERTIHVHATGKIIEDYLVNTRGPYLCLELSSPVGLSTGKARSLEEIQGILRASLARLNEGSEKYGAHREAYQGMQTCMAWDTIYEPRKNRVVTPVSRIWNNDSGGYVLFCWDTYFAAGMAALDNRELAYSNAIEITRELTPEGFVPNLAYGTGVSSRDRSQPPVGSRIVLEIYRKYKEKWFLEEVFDGLLQWNRWFHQHRTNADGTLSWGSDPYAPYAGNRWETDGVNDRYGASLESGLDNSPMYDGVPFDPEHHLLMLSDAGLTGLYVMDCLSLAAIAEILERGDAAAELSQRAEETSAALETLWDASFGLFLNRRTDIGLFSRRISPTNFYPLFSPAVSPAQIARMLEEHFYNPEEFFGEWMMPSIARNDPAYPDQDYWRGRIWAPMNFLVYLGMRCHEGENIRRARRELAEKSEKLLLKEWRSHRHVHENYCADTGEGCNVSNSDRFYHWGGLLGLIALMEANLI